jgi:hypothetical protein
MKKKYCKNRKGSLLVGVAIVFLMISSVAVAIISRSTQGALLTTDAKKGYSAYQNSDENTEAFLDKLKLLDRNGNGDSSKIPENSNANSFCTDTSCLDKNGAGLPVGSKVKDIFNFKASSDLTQGLSRTIAASVSDRIDGGLNESSLTVKNCDGSSDCDGSWNKCNIYIKSNDTPAGEIGNYEVRRSIDRSLTYGAENGQDYGWRKISGGATGGYFDASNRSTIFKNGTDEFYTTFPNDFWSKTSGGQYDKTYHFSIKARNKNPFSLDSLYLADGSGDALKSVSIGSASCSGGAPEREALTALGCVVPGANPAGTEAFNEAYNCCNGTECYYPSPHWINDPAKKCALQECGHDPGDEVGVNPSGDATSGWCSPLKTSCLKGQSCAQPYRVVGYCINAPSASTQTSFFSSSSWTLSPKVKVYQGPGHDEFIGSRCAFHNCPGDVTDIAKCGGLPAYGASWSNTSTCSSNACGPYNFDINCNLSCISRYYGSNPNGDYPQGTCCTETCSDVVYDDWGECTDHRCQENACGTRTVIDDAWSKTCKNPSCMCGVAVSCTPDCAGSTNGSCNPVSTCTGTTSWSCQTGTDKAGKPIMGTCTSTYSYDCCQ